MNKPKVKFDNIDRKRVIEAVEKRYGVELKQVGRRSKWRQDKEGKNWWVIGGSVDWHGIPREMMEAEEQTPTGGMLVVACTRRKEIATDMEIFVGPVEQFVKAKDKLYRNQETGDYEFGHKSSGTGARIQITGKGVFPIMHLDWLDSFSYEKAKKEKDKESDKKVKEFKRLFNQMTPEERQKFLQNLQGPPDQKRGPDD